MGSAAEPPQIRSAEPARAPIDDTSGRFDRLVAGVHGHDRGSTEPEPADGAAPIGRVVDGHIGEVRMSGSLRAFWVAMIAGIVSLPFLPLVPAYGSRRTSSHRLPRGSACRMAA